MRQFAQWAGRRFAAFLLFSGVVAGGGAAAQEFTQDQIQGGARIYSRNCSPCHGARMRDPEGAFDLRKFPPDGKERFINSVTNGKGQMPPWGGLLSPDDIASVWSYVAAGEKLEAR